MRRDHNNTHNAVEYSPYVPSYREGKWEKITLIRSTIIICITIITIGALMTIYNTAHDKYAVLKSSHGIYIFDKSSGITNYCDALGCVAVSTGFLKPGSNSFSHQPARSMPYETYPYGYGNYGSPHTPYYNVPNYPMNGYGYQQHPIAPAPYYNPYWEPTAPYPYNYNQPYPAPMHPLMPSHPLAPMRSGDLKQNVPAKIDDYKLVPDEDMGAVVATPEEEEKPEAAAPAEEKQPEAATESTPEKAKDTTTEASPAEANTDDSNSSEESKAPADETPAEQ